MQTNEGGRNLYPARLRTTRYAYILLCLFGCLQLKGQNYYHLHTPSITEGVQRDYLLSLTLKGEGFFRNNEYASDLVEDYTLPGYRLNMALEYKPRTKIPVQFRLGLTNIYYWGASLYPAALAYQDLPYWSGEEGNYTKFRIKPFFQVAITPRPNFAIILGALEGGGKHNLIEPIYNPELNLTADYESGVQIKYETAKTTMDFWVDWQSFIYKHAQHPEAFVFGSKMRQRIWRTKSTTYDISLQALAHHRGGVLNHKPDTVHSWFNTALGLTQTKSITINQHNMVWQNSLHLLGYTQRGDHYAIDRGWGIYLASCLEWNNWQIQLAGWRGYDFISVLGTPFVQSVDHQNRQAIHSHRTEYLQLSAQYKLLERSHYTFGASTAIWWHPHSTHTISSHIELYLSISPYFGLLR